MNFEAYPLNSDHAQLLADLETVYPDGMRQGYAVLHERLTLLEESEWSFSWLLFSGDDVVGYILAYPSFTMLDGEDREFVIYVDDVQVDLEHPASLYRLLKLMIDDIETSAMGHLPIEALARRSAYRVLKEHPRVVSRLGYELVATHEYWDEAVGEELCWMRWEPGEQAGATLGGDSLELSRDLLEDLELERS